MRSTIWTLKHAVPAALILLASTTAIAAAAKDVIAARQAHYKDLGKAFKAINDQLKTSTPDLAVIKANAPTVTKIGQQQQRETWFPAGTQSGQGLQTSAAAAIWKSQADFNAKRADFARASAGFAAIAAKGDLDGIRAAVGAVGRTCKACHETYREEDKS